MQANQLSDHQLVENGMKALCAKAGYSDPAALVQRDLQTLADGIETKTGVLISLSTMKRLQNGQFSRLPQISTLNAIAQYLDYPNWQAFCAIQKPAPQKPVQEPATQKPATQEPTPQKPPKEKRRIIIPLSLLLLATLALLAVRLIHNAPANFDKAQFSATKVTGNDIPNSVVFHYNIDDVNADSFFIQQSWDKSRRVRIYKKKYTLTDIYYEPGYHIAKLFAGDKIIKTIPVSIPTDRWFFSAREQFFKGKIAYINQAKASGLTTQDLIANNIDPKRYNAYMQLYFPSEIKYSSDDFTLHCRIKVNDVNNANCPLLMTEIYCQRYFMYFQTTPKGCTSELTAQFGDTIFNGKTQDLSALGSNIDTWQNLDLTVKNHQATISFNGIKAFSTPYNASCGLITGLGFIANGLCAVDSVCLRTGDGHIIFPTFKPTNN